MKVFLLIFALLIASCDENEPIPCKSVAIQISDANPIQFWPIECETYNEKEVCGIHSKCWCHPWECDDEIPTQFTDTDPSEEYSLVAYNSDSEVLATIPFVSSDKFYTENNQSFNNDDFFGSLIPWEFYAASGSEAGWMWDVSGALADGTAGTYSKTNEISQSRLNLGNGGYDKFPPGDYVFKIKVSNASTGGTTPPEEALYLQATNTLGVFEEAIPLAISVPRGGGFIEYTVPFTITEARKFFSLYFYKQGPTGGSAIKIYMEYFRIDSSPLDYTFTAHSNSFIPSDEDICNEQVKFVIESDISSPSEVLKSDCIDVREEQKCTTLIEYSNNRNFAGLIYDNISPEQIFNIRVPAIFFHNNFVEEDEAMDLTTGVTKTSGTLKVQRLFDTDYMPYYMHQKLILIFKHQSILIDALYWIKESAYEIQEGNRMWPVKKAKVFLTENYIQRAVL